jgi:hypothetical protein
MARDRNVYVWQAYVIVMSIVSALAIGFMCLVIFQSGTNSKTVEGALAKQQKADEELRKAVNARQVLERFLGVGKPIPEPEFQSLLTSQSGDEQLNLAAKAYTTNMALFGPGASERSYTKLVDTLMQELRTRNMQVDTLSKRELDMKDKYDLTIAQETKAREAEKAKAQDLANQLEKALTNYTEKLAEQQQTITKIEADKQTLVKSLEKKIKDATTLRDKSEAENEELRKRLDTVVRKLEQIEGEDFQYVQGRITEIANGGDTVWINLGKADGLRPGVTFGVLDGDVSRVADARPKARIEVVSIVNDSEHLARCKVLSDHSPTTILRGDSIYSPAWQPGPKVQFVLVGKMDLDRDGKDDTESLKSLIEQNGGVVSKDLTIDTRWLVIGEEFKFRGADLDDPTLASAAKQRAALEQQAKSLGVSRINLDKLKGWLRGSGVAEVTPIGTGLRSKPSDYLPNTGNTHNSGRVSELFQNRDGRINPKAPQP